MAVPILSEQSQNVQGIRINLQELDVGEQVT